MKSYRVEEIEPGMVLQREVRDKQDRVLIPEGAVLTEKHRDLLVGRGVQTVQVRDVPPPPTPTGNGTANAEVPAPDSDTPSPEELVRRKDLMLRIQHMFEGTLSDPLMKQIFTISMKRAHGGALHD